MNRLPRLNEKTDDTLCRSKQETACYLSTLSSDLDLKSQTISPITQQIRNENIQNHHK